MVCKVNFEFWILSFELSAKPILNYPILNFEFFIKNSKFKTQNWTIPNARSAQFKIQNSKFKTPLTAALYAEGGEECGEHAHDELDYGFDGFFLCVFHGILIIKVIDWTFASSEVIEFKEVIEFIAITLFADYSAVRHTALNSSSHRER